MSQPSSNDDGLFMDAPQGTADVGMPEAMPTVAPQYRKQGFSIYTMMLILSFVALTAAAIIFYVNIQG